MVNQTQDKLSILMNGQLVGHLIRNTSGVLTFDYDQTWLDRPQARPISLSLPLVKQHYEGSVVYNFFDNLLPDDLQIRERIRKKYQIPTTQPFDLLATIGRDCVGAIQVITGDIPTFKKEIKYHPLTTTELADTLKNFQNAPLGMSNNHEPFRISLAGAQAKMAFLRHNGKWCKPLGTTPTTHIFKLPIGHLDHWGIDLSDSCENEWICSQIANAFNLATAKCEVKTFKDIKVLIVERFDRKIAKDKTWLMRLPQEDMCQVLGISSDNKYQSRQGPGIKTIMDKLLASRKASEDRDNFFRAQVLFWLLAAIDGHAKNFSVFIEPTGHFSLTPLYDILSVHPLMADKRLQRKDVQMAMALEGKNRHYKWHTAQRRHFIETAHKAYYSVEKAEQILVEMLNQVDDVITKVSRQLPSNFPKNISQPIFDGMVAFKNRIAKGN